VRRIFLAYDGSLHGDWIARYAIRLARCCDGVLEVLHVEDGASRLQDLEARIRPLQELGAATGVSVSVRGLPPKGADVAEALMDAVPSGPDAMLLTGLRARASQRGLLHTTVSERLLRMGRQDVLALRVVSPYLLGHARHVLWAVSQNPFSVQGVEPFLQVLAPELTKISLLTVMSPRLGRRFHPTASDLELMRVCGMDFLHRLEARLRSALGPLNLPVDPHVEIATDWASEITRHAGRARAELVLVGATERTLTRQFVFGNPLERVLKQAVCDVGIFRRSFGRGW